jgi:hypothetical protein
MQSPRVKPSGRRFSASNVLVCWREINAWVCARQSRAKTNRPAFIGDLHQTLVYRPPYPVGQMHFRFRCYLTPIPTRASSASASTGGKSATASASSTKSASKVGCKDSHRLVMRSARGHRLGSYRLGTTTRHSLKLTRLRVARQAFAGGVFDAAYSSALFAGVSAPDG